MVGAEAGDAPLALDAARSWVGRRLDEVGGGRVGSIAAVLVGAGTERPEWLLARMGRFGHHTLVPSRDAVEGFGRVWVPYSRELIREAPWLEPGVPLRAALERELLEHYGVAADAARTAYLASRNDDAITARPA